jgi:hypothetical protein
MTLPLAQAYLEQAKADYRTYEIIRQAPGQPSSQWLHLLQMTLEKTAKAYLAAAHTDFDKLRESHRVFRRFVQMLPRNETVRTALGMSAETLREHIRNLATLIDAIEQLVPGKGNEGPTAEYPWRNPRGGFHSPCTYGFVDLVSAINDTARGRNLLRILERGLYEESWHAAFGIKDNRDSRFTN